jgi:hypothetical protein
VSLTFFFLFLFSVKVARYGVTKFPSVVLLKKDSDPVQYTGAVKPLELHAFIKSHVEIPKKTSSYTKVRQRTSVPRVLATNPPLNYIT